MKAIITMEVTELGPDAWIYEDFEGTQAECRAWAFTKRDEFIDLIGWDAGFVVSGHEMLMVTDHKDDFLIYLGGNRRTSDYFKAMFYGD